MPLWGTAVEPPPAVADLAATAAKHAEQAETQRRLSPDVVTGLRTAGFARHFVPAAFGGSQGGYEELLDMVAPVAAGCPSTGWSASIAAHTGRMAVHLPEQGQREVWGEHPDALIAGALVPSGTATSVAGGWRVTGRWAYVSGADYSDWALICAPGGTGTGTRPWCFVLPREHYEVADTWFSVGMRATGSNTVVVRDVLVPKHRSFTRAALEAGLDPDDERLSCRAPLKAVNGLSFAGPLLGAARGLLEHWVDWISRKVDTHTGTPACDRPAVRAVLARSSAEVEAAALLVRSIARTADSGRELSPFVARHMRDWSYATELLRDAAERIFVASGTAGQGEGDRAQRFWRDIHAGASHFALQLEQASGPFAESVFTTPNQHTPSRAT
ncbi:acyl-CoA dehydrogenase family protein [Streptomyces sp. NPDC048219]|uniref:acyl-CoA dehydrogenase family protein n=1 Tax=Streptomyces sp. NPDC048219 TaxID=3365517 RepID=UPI00371A2E3F